MRILSACADYFPAAEAPSNLYAHPAIFGGMRDRFLDYHQTLEFRLLGMTMFLGLFALCCALGIRTAHGLPIPRQAHIARHTDMAAAHAVSGFGRASGRPVGDLIARLGAKVRRLLNPNWLLFRSGKTTDELIVARHGPVEIRRTLAGWSLETCVKGEPDRARATALRRLSNYVDGKNRSSTRLCAARPLVQTEESMDRWRISVALPGVDSDFVTASGRNGRVRLRALDSETWP